MHMIPPTIHVFPLAFTYFIILTLAIPLGFAKCDLRKYVNAFKARSQKSVNKHNPTCGMSFIYSYWNWYDQLSFSMDWKRIWC